MSSLYVEDGYCLGCGKSGLTPTGFHAHISSSSSLCRTIFLARTSASQRGQVLSDDAHPIPSAPLPNFDFDSGPIPFAGDIFGDATTYANDDFGQGAEDGIGGPPSEDESGGLCDEDESDEEWIAAADSRDSWEPPVAGASTAAVGITAPNSGLAPNVNHEGGSTTTFTAPSADPQQNDVRLDPIINQESHSGPYFPHPMSSSVRHDAESRAGTQQPVINRYSDIYPLSQPGRSHSCDGDSTVSADAHSAADNPYAPFASKMEWEVARWAKLRGAGSTSFSELLAIDGIKDALGLSFGTTPELNRLIDTKLPGRPRFERKEAVIGGEAHEFYARDVEDCIKALWAEPDFASELVFEPERHYADADATVRLYHDMHTGKWWWGKQRELDAKVGPGVMVVPVIISSDKTQLTTFRNITAYPVYLTLGNLPKHIRRKPSRQAQVLLAYLPATKLDSITNKAARRRSVANLFHQCMAHILQPLVKAGNEGIDLISGDGLIRRGHPILAAYVGDYPEQLLVTLIKNGWCPTCPAEKDNLGDADGALPPRDVAPIRATLAKVVRGPTIFTKACADAGIRPIQSPFWRDLPLLNIYSSIVPDVLHQLSQGVLKHLILWLRSVYGDAEIDARCRRLPPNHNIRLFFKGISSLSRVTGTEHAQIAQILLSLVIGAPLPDDLSNARLIRAVRAMLDFIYLAQYPIHSSETLDLLDDALDRFHQNKDIFIDLGIRTHFNFPKLHSTGHYRFYIELFGTTDNYNTAYTERLHIDLAKDAYRATNRKDEYMQMTAWLDRRERIHQHGLRIKRRLEWLEEEARGMHPKSTIHVRPPPTITLPRVLAMARHPSARNVSLDSLANDYGAVNLKPALARFITRTQHPEYSSARIETAIRTFYFPFEGLNVFHRVKFTHRDPYSYEAEDMVVDSIHIQPSRSDRYGKLVPGRFDTAIITLQSGEPGIRGSSVGRIRCVFTLPKAAIERWFTHTGIQPPSTHFAYVDWFSDFPLRADTNHGLYKVSHLLRHNEKISSIVPVDSIWQSIHLYPDFGTAVDRSWTSSDVLDRATHFYVNPFTSRFSYSTIY